MNQLQKAENSSSIFLQRLGMAGLSVLIIGFLTFQAYREWPRYAYSRENHAAFDLIKQLRDRCPDDVHTNAWNNAIDWTFTAHGNVCFSESHVSLVELRRFRIDLEERLAGEVDLATFDWIWQRLAETGPHGRAYRDKYWSGYRQDVDEALAEQNSR